MGNPLSFLGWGDRRRAPQRRRIAPRPSSLPPRRFEPGRFEIGRPPAPPPRPRLRLSWRRLGIIVLAASGGTAVLVAGAWLFSGDTFRVRNIEVRGAQVADAQQIVRAAGVTGASLFSFDGVRAAEGVAALPAVKRASVTRVWPHGARIEVVEHQAWGYWQSGSQRLVIDVEGQVLQQSRPPAQDAPTIVELGASSDAQGRTVTDADTVRLVERLRADGTLARLQVQATGFFFRRDSGLTVMVANGPAALFGDSSNYDFKVHAWQSVLAQQRSQPGAPARPSNAPPPTQAGARGAAEQLAARTGSGATSEIDLRFGRNVVLR